MSAYTRLFEAMMAWYARRKVDASYRRAYTLITMSVLAFLNINSLLLFGVRLNVDVAKAIFAVERHFPTSAILAVGLLIAHMVYFRAHKVATAEATPDSNVIGPSGRIAAAYLIMSFVLVVYASRWAPMVR